MESSPDSSAGDDLFVNVIFTLVGTLSSLGGMAMDVFILAVNCRDWMKKKRLSLTDKILTLQGSIRICFACMALKRYILKNMLIGYNYKVFRFIFWYFASCNVWLTASLCSYYCVKIADFRHPVFIHLKLRLSSGLVSTWVLGSAILSFASNLPFACVQFQVRHGGNFSHFFQDKNVTDISPTTLELRSHALLGLGYFPAFSICATSAVLLLFSLWRHHQRMRGSWDSRRSPQADAHFQAVITISFLLISHVLVFGSTQYLLSSGPEGNLIARHIAVDVLYISTSAESLISVWGNKKLKNEMHRYLCVAKCRGCAS